MQPTAAGTRGLAVLWLLVFGACTKDFSRFQFHDLAGNRDAGKIVSTDSGMDAQTSTNNIDGDIVDSPSPESGIAKTDTGTPEDAGKSDTSTMREDTGPRANQDSGTPVKMPDHDAHMPQDARMPDATQPPPDAQVPPDAHAPDDAQVPTDTQRCLDSYAEIDSNSNDCRACTCERCTDIALDCLAWTDIYARALCTALWKCAVEHGCRDWDCYCDEKDIACRMTMSTQGTGPCVTQMENAARGGRDAVGLAHMTNDPSSPLVRAVKAIACTIGTEPPSIGAMLTPMCKEACGAGGTNLP